MWIRSLQRNTPKEYSKGTFIPIKVMLSYSSLEIFMYLPRSEVKVWEGASPTNKKANLEALSWALKDKKYGFKTEKTQKLSVLSSCRSNFDFQNLSVSGLSVHEVLCFVSSSNNGNLIKKRLVRFLSCYRSNHKISVLSLSGQELAIPLPF